MNTIHENIPTRFMRAYTKFLESTGYREPDRIEIAYDQIYNMVMEWNSLNVVKVSSVEKMFSNDNVDEIEIVPVIDDDQIYTGTIIRAYVILDVPVIEEPDLNTQVSVIRTWLKKLTPTISVKKNRGTSYGWINITGSDEFGEFTDQEREALLKAGLNPGGNYEVICPGSRKILYVKALDQLSIMK